VLEVLHGNDLLRPLVTFLSTWMSSDVSHKLKSQRLYAALTQQWRDEWPYPKFDNFINRRSLKNFRLGEVSANGETTNVLAELDFGDRTEPWEFSLIYEKGRLRLHRTLRSTIPSPTRRCRVEDLKRNQSGRDTGRRHLVFSGIVHNGSRDALLQMHAQVLWRTWSQAKCTLGDVAPSSAAVFSAVWPEAFVPQGDNPPLSGRLLQGRVRVKLVYCFETDEGDFWSEEDAFGQELPF